MQRNTTSRRWRETVVILTLAVMFGGTVSFFLLLIGGGFLLSMLVALAIVAAIGCLHYLVWGQTLERDQPRQRKDEARRPMIEDVWTRGKNFPTLSVDSADRGLPSPSANGAPLVPMDGKGRGSNAAP